MWGTARPPRPPAEPRSRGALPPLPPSSCCSRRGRRDPRRPPPQRPILPPPPLVSSRPTPYPPADLPRPTAPRRGGDGGGVGGGRLRLPGFEAAGSLSPSGGASPPARPHCAGGERGGAAGCRWVRTNRAVAAGAPWGPGGTRGYVTAPPSVHGKDPRGGSGLCLSFPTGGCGSDVRPPEGSTSLWHPDVTSPPSPPPIL